MIEFKTKEQFLAAGLGFTDYFEEKLFEFFIDRDGSMYYDPVSMYMFDQKNQRIFYVEQVYIGNNTGT